MPVDTPSRDYKANSDTWAQIRALSAGAAAARAHVLEPPGMKPDRIASFRKRAYYLPALPRTVETFGGLIFLRDPKIEAPDGLDDYREDATLTGLPFEGLASWVVSEMLEVSRVAVHVDFPPAEAGLTVAEAERRGLRAYARVYETETILGADYERVGGVRRLSRVRLKESRYETDPETFEETEIKRVRVLELRGGEYVQRVFEQEPNSGQWNEVESFTPLRNGAPLDYIPIFFFNHRDHDATPIRPPLADLAEVSISHLNTSALLEWGELWTANPTPWFAGVQAAPTNDEGETENGSTYAINLGSSEAILLDKEGSAGFLEFGGQGLDRLAETMDRKEKHMAALGTRMLLDDPRAPVAAETARIQRAGENSTLGKIATIASKGLTAVLRELALWAGVQDVDSITVTLNRNFMPAGLTPEQIKAYLAAIMAGEMSSQEFYSILQSADLVPEQKPFEEHQEEIQQNPNLVPPDDPERQAA